MDDSALNLLVTDDTGTSSNPKRLDAWFAGLTPQSPTPGSSSGATSSHVPNTVEHEEAVLARGRSALAAGHAAVLDSGRQLTLFLQPDPASGRRVADRAKQDNATKTEPTDLEAFKIFFEVDVKEYVSTLTDALKWCAQRGIPRTSVFRSCEPGSQSVRIDGREVATMTCPGMSSPLPTEICLHQHRALAAGIRSLLVLYDQSLTASVAHNTPSRPPSAEMCERIQALTKRRSAQHYMNTKLARDNLLRSASMTSASQDLEKLVQVAKEDPKVAARWQDLVENLLPAVQPALSGISQYCQNHGVPDHLVTSSCYSADQDISDPQGSQLSAPGSACPSENLLGFRYAVCLHQWSELWRSCHELRDLYFSEMSTRNEASHADAETGASDMP